MFCRFELAWRWWHYKRHRTQTEQDSKMEDFKQLLKGLGKQAQAAQAEEKQREQEAAQLAAEEVDFAKEMGAVKPLKQQNRAPRYVDETPPRLR